MAPDVFDSIIVRSVARLWRIYDEGGNISIRFDGSGIDVHQEMLFGAGTGIGFDSTTGSSIGNASDKMSFYGATPIVKPTGVAVSAAGIHAALVSLGLIAA